jgi:hypothetical protein
LALSEEKKVNSQIESATRSLRTNLILFGILLLAAAFLNLVPAFLKSFLTTTVFTVFKAAFPLLTAVANFGTVQSVASTYWNYLKAKFGRNGLNES